MSKNQTTYQGLVLSRFCMQISILLKSAVPLYEGLEAMARMKEMKKNGPRSCPSRKSFAPAIR